MLKISIMKNYSIKYRSENFLKFGLSMLVGLRVCSNHCGIISPADFTHHNTIVNMQIVIVLLFMENDHCPEIAFSGQQNDEN